MEKVLLFRGFLFASQNIPTFFQGLNIRRDDPSAVRLNARTRPPKKFRKRGKSCPSATLLRQERLAPTACTLLPTRTMERELCESFKLVLALALWQRRIAEACQHLSILVRSACGKDDAHWLLNSLKNAHRHIRL